MQHPSNWKHDQWMDECNLASFSLMATAIQMKHKTRTTVQIMEVDWIIIIIKKYRRPLNMQTLNKMHFMKDTKRLFYHTKMENRNEIKSAGIYHVK